MTRTFIQTNEFSREWDNLGFSDQDLRKLELEIMENPKIGSVIRGTGRLRKMRYGYENAGKRGGVRVCYIDFEEWDTIYFITVYGKGKKENLTKKECSNIKSSIAMLEKGLKRRVDHERSI